MLLKQVLQATRLRLGGTKDWDPFIDGRTRSIVEQCSAIAKAIAKDIVTYKFEVVGRIVAGKERVFSDQLMQIDTNDDSGHSIDPRGVSLLCVTRLGLRGWERRRGRKHVDESSDVVLLKARVFLQAAA